VVEPDLVILDLDLPKKGGRAFLTETQADRELRAIPMEGVRT
jgi:CheY-like chemotaxis protein